MLKSFEWFEDTTLLTVKISYQGDTIVAHKKSGQTKTLNDSFVNDGFSEQLGLEYFFI